jgi:hypothetical protein
MLAWFLSHLLITDRWQELGRLATNIQLGLTDRRLDLTQQLKKPDC